MANNPYVNKVVYGDQTVIDLTMDDLVASDLRTGKRAHDRSGAPIQGTANIDGAIWGNITGDIDDQTDLQGELAKKVVTLTKAQYDALSSTEKNDPKKVYYVTDYDPIPEELDDKCDNSVIAPVEKNATASRAYAIGEHFIRDGAFCTAKTAIAQGAAFTLNTNYTVGDVANNLEKLNDFIGHKIIQHMFGNVDSFTFDLPEGATAILAFNHPYGVGAQGMYLIVGGYTTSVGAFPIVASNDITITKPTITSVKVEAAKSTFMTAIY